MNVNFMITYFNLNSTVHTKVCSRQRTREHFWWMVSHYTGAGCWQILGLDIWCHKSSYGNDTLNLNAARIQQIAEGKARTLNGW